jgi:hypothetical protein
LCHVLSYFRKLHFSFRPQNGDGIIENSNNDSGAAEDMPQRLPLTFDPKTLDKLKSNPDFIAAYGSIPAFKTSEERKSGLIRLIKYLAEPFRKCRNMCI